MPDFKYLYKKIFFGGCDEKITSVKSVFGTYG